MTANKVKSTELFKQVINDKLEEMAREDELFARNFYKANKNIEDCIIYILNQVKQSGICGFTDDEVFGMAAHYYDEDDIEVGTHVECRIISNHYVQLTEEELQEAKKIAYEREIIKQRSKLTRKRQPAPMTVIKNTEAATQNTLF